jgi:hypothetical protein
MKDRDAAIYAQVLGVKLVVLTALESGECNGQYLGGEAVKTSNGPILPIALQLISNDHWTVVALKTLQGNVCARTPLRRIVSRIDVTDIGIQYVYRYRATCLGTNRI